MTDVLSEIMRRVRLTACVYFQRDFCAPWSMRMADTGFAQFHVVTAGDCVLEIDGESREVALGDVLLFPRGQAHSLADRCGRQAVSGREFMASLATDQPMFSEGNSKTRLICGHFAYRWDVSHPLISDLPDVVHVRAADPGVSPALLALMPLILSELSRCESGYELIVERYAEVLFFEILRHHFRQQDHKANFLAALADPRLGNAIARVHSSYADPLTLADLAQSAAMSRSAFCQRFADKVSMSPMDYLSRWRMLVAQDLLQTTDLPVAEIAEQVGYGSDIAFSRAYKRSQGVTPSVSRRR